MKDNRFPMKILKDKNIMDYILTISRGMSKKIVFQGIIENIMKHYESIMKAHYELIQLFSELVEHRKSQQDSGREKTEEDERLENMIITFDPELAKERVREALKAPATEGKDLRAVQAPTPVKKGSGGCRGVNLEKYLQDHLPQVRQQCKEYQRHFHSFW